MLHYDWLEHKRITVVGLGATGRSCVAFLRKHNAEVTVTDSRAYLDTQGIDAKVVLGRYCADAIANAELVVISPGVDPKHVPLHAANEKGIEVIGDVELFARFNQTPVVAITGSNGKSSVTTLVHDMLQASGLTAKMGGNIGVPVLDLLECEADILVLELSSFQLETIHSLAPKVACVLNVSDDHLDRHGDMDTYVNMKRRIYLNSTFQVCHREDANTWPMRVDVKHTFGLSVCDSAFSWNPQTQTILLHGRPFLPLSECAVMGAHNALNIQAAAMCALLAGATEEAVIEGAKRFKGLPHRCEVVTNRHGTTWINDSKATNVGATLAAIEGIKPTLGRGKLILIAGGDSKGADLSPLDSALKHEVAELLLIGRDADKFSAIQPKAKKFDSLAEAVNFAATITEVGDVVLLSPACASLDMFDNYQHRGQVFASAVEALSA
ncbi:UDP-N-acetylmuramoyl-L-alanine--D-glutamate ligase [Aestuariibacter sp. AA17]|uniref:UDP-N-acetylmuramoylalanine--D-glutamate ligase n=1 Tax=Fluctibacter corallii TaxID=2984329 RepID=A0ABT3A8E9_9ALTE|nr:UDP-N-acetylmuramoyl-L-alanine--D-glutamate ligase [Aestuariibacter sp. AA17]MCV2884885.1 UDP-N-acetylmuramoyl-L-alanine--D-glutamate ligase [Aestuariibacter sp. AA17]